MASCDLCESCLLKDKSSTAVKLCTDCDEKLCGECSVNHLGFKAFKIHHLILLTSIPTNMPSFQKYCSVHSNMGLDFYCAYHDTTCCRACIPKTHQTCEDVVPLEVASKDIQNSSLLKDTIEELTNITHTLNQVLKSHETSMKRLDNSTTSIIQEIAAHKSRLIKQLNQIEQKLIHELTSAQENIKTEMERTKSYVAEKITENEKRKHDVEFLKAHGTNNQLFLALHKLDIEIKDTGTKISEIISTCKDTDIHYDETTTNIESLGNITQTSRPFDLQYTPVKLRQAQKQTDITLQSLTKLKYDSTITLRQGENYHLTDIAVTGDNKLLLCNYSDRSPKVYFYKNCTNFEKELTFSGPPYKIAIIPGTNRAVIVLRDERSIQFINTTSMIKEDKIKLGLKPWSVTASFDRIFIAGSSRIRIFNMKGIFQKNISISGIDNIYFTRLNNHDTEILCRSSDKLYYVDLYGHILYQYNVPGVAGVAVDGQGDVYVGDYYERRIHRLSQEGKLRAIILNRHDRVNYPDAMAFNNDFNKLFIVGNYNTVNCFTCS